MKGLEDFISHTNEEKTRFLGTEVPARRPVEGYVGLDRMRAVGVWYSTPLDVHLRGVGGAPGHEPSVEKVTCSTCPKPRKTSYAPIHERPT